MRFSFRQLDTFRTFARTLSVTEAARLMNVSQSAVSHTLRELEAQMGFKLFFRSGNRLRLTSEGKTLLPTIERIFAQVAQLEGEAEGARNADGGQLYIASLQSIGPWLLDEACARFLQERPRLSLTLRTHAASEVLDTVRNETANIGFTMLGNDDAGIFLEPLMRAELLCALPPSHPLTSREVLTAADLHNERLIVPARFTVVGTELIDKFPAERLRRHDVLQVNQTSVVLGLAARGLGVGLVHPFGMMAGIPRVELRPFRPHTPLRVMQVFSRNRPVSRLITSFVRQVRAVAGERIAGSGLGQFVALE